MYKNKYINTNHIYKSSPYICIYIYMYTQICPNRYLLYMNICLYANLKYCKDGGTLCGCILIHKRYIVYVNTFKTIENPLAFISKSNILMNVSCCFLSRKPSTSNLTSRPVVRAPMCRQGPSRRVLRTSAWMKPSERERLTSTDHA